MDNHFFPQAGFLQFEVQLGDPRANLETVARLISQLQPEENSIIVLPELWSSGFDYDYAEDHARKTPELLEQLLKLSRQYTVFFAGSLIEKDQAASPQLYNTLFLTGPEGLLGKYRKQHLFALWQEDEHFLPGSHFQPVTTPFGRVGALVCYDLRFPEIARNQAFHGAGLIVVSAEWPAIRLDHWQTLLQARAIENQVFIAACNSCGKTGGTDMAGHSMIIAPDGSILAEGGDCEDVGLVILPEDKFSSARGKFCCAGDRPRPSRDSEKLVILEQLTGRLNSIRQQGSQVAFTNGCFDILHSGHVSYLEKARATADCLVVGLNSDASVKALKGEGRPVNSEKDRARVLAALGSVDFVVLFGEDTPLKLIKAIMPDILVKGADWTEEEIVGASEIKEAGGSVVRVEFEHDLSTTGLISRVQRQDSKKE